MQSRWLGLGTILFAVALVACDDGNVDFVDAGRDAGGVDAAPAPAGALPLGVDLALVDCGGTGQQSFTVMNTGSAELTFSLALSDAAFTVTPASGSIAAGASTTFTVEVTVPQAATAGTQLTATLTATTNLPGSPHSVPVRVTPRGAHITLTPPSVGFGQVEAGTTSSPSAVLVANTGNAPATVVIAVPGGEFARLFGTNGSLILAGSQSASASFTYAPTALGADNGASAVTVSGVHCGTAPTTIPLSGTGAITGGVLVQGTPVNFGTPACGSSASSATVTLMNTAEVAAAYTASFPTDAEGDHLRYTVAPLSGTIAANSSVVLTVTRSAVALPFQPRALDAVLRVNVDIPTSTDTNVPVQQTLTGPFLLATPGATNFGYAHVSETRTGPIAIMNTGNAAATIQGSTSAPFALQLPAMVGGGNTGNGTMTFTPTVLGATPGSATITAASACSSAVPLTFTAGDGPHVDIYTYGASTTCPAPSPFSGSIYITNDGNQPLDIACVDVNSGTNGFAAAFVPTTLNLAATNADQIVVTVSPGAPIRAGEVTTTMRCTTNEPLGNIHDLPYRRTLYGSDLVLAAPAPLDFTCYQSDSLPYTITSAVTSNQTEFVNPTDQLVLPLSHNFSQPPLDPGSSVTNFVETYGGGSQFHGVGGDFCDAAGSGGATPGMLIFTGSVGVETGKSSICSTTPATLPVRLFYAVPPS